MNTIRSLNPHQKLVLAVAYLKAQRLQGKQMEAILRQNGYSSADEPRIAEFASEAVRNGWLRTVVPEELFSPDLMEEIRTMASPQRELERRLGTTCDARTLKGLRIFYSGKEGISEENWDARLEYFAPLASRRVAELLREAESIGVGWGHTVAELEKFLNRAPKRLKNKNMRFIPTSGEPLGPISRPDRASSVLALRLSDKWGCVTKSPSLAGVAAVIPGVFHGKEKEVVRKYIGHINDYKLVFGPNRKGKALIDTLDSIITSVGSFTGQWHMYQSELIRTGGISRETLRELCLGDIGGALIPRNSLSAPQAREFHLIAESWTGIRVEHYRQIARAASSSSVAGSIVVAIGANKAEIVLEVVRRGLVNELIIDHDLAEALNKLAAKL